MSIESDFESESDYDSEVDVEEDSEAEPADSEGEAAPAESPEALRPEDFLTITVEEYYQSGKIKKRFSEDAWEFYRLAGRPEGVSMPEFFKHSGKFPTTQQQNNFSKTAQLLCGNRLLAKFAVAWRNVRYFQTWEALKAYAISHGVAVPTTSVFAPIRRLSDESQLIAYQRQNQRNKNAVVASNPLRRKKEEVFRFAKDAVVDMSQAKVTVVKPPNVPTFNTTYDPNEKLGVSHRYANNLGYTPEYPVFTSLPTPIENNPPLRSSVQEKETT